jgi:putative restriction endonuclease
MCDPAISEKGLLVASHVKPWKDCNEKERFDPQNIIRLCAIHDKLFERGFLTISDDLHVLYAKDKISSETIGIVKRFTKDFLAEGTVGPLPEYLEWHRTSHSEMEPFVQILKSTELLAQ